MKKYFIKNILWTLFVLLSFNSTFSQTFSSLPNVSAIYSPSGSYLHPQYKLFVKSKNSADVYIKLNTKELNFIQLKGKNFQAKIKIKYLFYQSLENTDILDSASNIYVLNKKNVNESMITKFDVTIPFQKCFMVIITQDMYTKRKGLNFIRIENAQKSDAKFMLMDSVKNLPIFSNYIKPYKTYYLKTSFSSDSFLVQKFAVDSTFPRPPYSSSNSNFIYTKENQSYIKKSTYFKFKQKGIYKITNTVNNASFYFINLGNYYPNIYTPNEMIPPLKYFASTKEYKEILIAINKKLAIDNFWLNKNSSPEKARNLIKIYYNRIMIANLFFTSTKEGWKTDRGMIFTIFGQPSIIHKTSEIEEWVYYDAFNGKKISFIFNRVLDKNLFENYILERKSSYIEFWKKAIEEWNKGNIYSF